MGHVHGGAKACKCGYYNDLSYVGNIM
jgi:hypothetical protein